MVSGRIFGRLLVVSLFGFALTWLSPGIASAHAELVSSNPPAGAELTSLPDSVELVFSGPLLPTDAVLSAYDTDGNQLVLGAPVVEGSIVRAALTPPTEGGGNIVLSYRVMSEDGHPAKGQIAFSVDLNSSQVGNGSQTEPAVSGGSPEPPSAVMSEDLSPADGAGAGAQQQGQGDSGAVGADESMPSVTSTSEASPWIWWLLGAFVGALALTLVLFMSARHRRTRRTIDEEAKAVTAVQRHELTK